MTNSILQINTPAALAQMLAILSAQTTIAVDTEADSLYSYFEKVCLVQISTRDADYIVDPLAVDLAPLGAIFADARIEKTFHAAEYDILSMKRDYHFEFANLFDTMIAARVLGWKNIGLGTILQERYGVALNKKFQRADWGHRPLSAEQIAYARDDTHHLLALRDLQAGELERIRRLEEAHEEFERLCRVKPTPRRFDPDAFWNIKGARDLDPPRLGILRELYRFRDAQARREDHPPFKVLSDATMLAVANGRPTSPRGLQNFRGITPHLFQRYGAAILDAIGKGIAHPQSQIPRPQMNREPPMDNATRERLARLKEWRKVRAGSRGVATDVILSNDLMYQIARKHPRAIEGLTEIGLGAAKTKEYGEEILVAVDGRKK